MRSAKIVVNSTVMPITLEQAKEHLHILHNDDDVRIQRIIEAGVSYVERFTGLALVPKTIEFYGEAGIQVLPFSPINTMLTGIADIKVMPAVVTLTEPTTLIYECGDWANFGGIAADVMNAIYIYIDWQYYGRVDGYSETAIRNILEPHKVNHGFA